MSDIYDIIVIGGGAAGIMSAYSAKKVEKKLNIAILEASSSICNKLRMTGGGRCNLTNNKDISEFFSYVVNNEKFLYSSFNNFTNRDLIKMVNDLGLNTIVENGNDDKVYLKNGNSQELINAFEDIIWNEYIDLYLDKKVKKIKTEEDCISVYTKEKILQTKSLIIATGGASFPQTGSDGSMYRVLEKMGYTLKEIKPALVPIIASESWISDVVGISLENVVITVVADEKNDKESKNKESKALARWLKKLNKKRIEGGMLFTHDGIGGPAALKVSSFINRYIDDVYLEVDYIPQISKDELQKIVKNDPKKSVFQNIKSILPQNLLKTIVYNLDNTIENYSLISNDSGNLSDANFEKLYEAIKKSKITPVALKEIEKATITSGGIEVKNINPSTLESKLHKNIYFAGEVIDVDALTGGYNLQIAFSTGYLAGESAANNICLSENKGL